MDGGHASEDLSRDLRRRGALILALFALVWAAAGISGIGNDGVVVFALLGTLVVTALAVLLALRAGPAKDAERWRRLPADWMRRYWLVGIVQGVSIGLVVVFCVATGWPTLIPAAVCLIVGVHFFPLARTFDQVQYWWTGAALCAVAVIGFVALAAGGEMSRAVVGFGAALSLWGTSLHVSLHG